METRKLLLEEDMPYGVIPQYEVDQNIPAFYLSEDGTRVMQFLSEEKFPKIVIPLIEKENRDIDDLVHTVISTAAMGNDEISVPSFEAAHQKITEGLILRDLEIDSILVNHQTIKKIQNNEDLHKLFEKIKMTSHDEVESDVIYGMPSCEFLGRLVYRGSKVDFDVFGIIVHNPGAIIKTRIEDALSNL
jgi:hypothetical protein